jgi:D-amino-acid dehydrogenase
MDRISDLLVIGGGVIGASIAHESATQGAAVRLIERETEICPAVSAAHANCGLVVPSDVVPLASPGALGRGLRWLLDSSSPFYIRPRASASLARWLALFLAACRPRRAQATAPILRELGSTGAELHYRLGAAHGDSWRFRHNGVLQAYETTDGFKAALVELEEARRLGVAADVLSRAETRSRYAALRGDVTGAVFYPEDAHLDPMAFTRAVAGLAAQAGADVRTSTEAFGIDAGASGPVRVYTTRGEFRADQVVVAAGAWTPGLARRLGLCVPIEPAKGYSVDLPCPPGLPDLPLYLGEAHVVLTPLGNTLRVGSTLELSGWDMRVRPKRVAHLRRGAARALGVSEQTPADSVWRGPRPVTPDGLPIIGRLPRAPKVIVAGGHCMLGLSLALVTARLVTELAGGGTPSIDLQPLRPDRY